MVTVAVCSMILDLELSRPAAKKDPQNSVYPIQMPTAVVYFLLL